MKNSKQRKRIEGFEVMVLDGKEVTSNTPYPSGDAVAKINGPHHNSKRAKNLTERYEPNHKLSFTRDGGITAYLRFQKVI